MLSDVALATLYLHCYLLPGIISYFKVKLKSVCFVLQGNYLG